MKSYPRVLEWILKWRMILVLIIVFIGMSLAAPAFLTLRNFEALLRRVSIDGLFSVGMAFALVGGMFDLSMASIAALAGIVSISLQPLGVIPACLIAVATACLIGVVNGALVSKWRINALISTLATMLGVKGMALVYTGGGPVHGQVRAFTVLGNGSIGPIPYVTLIFTLALLIGHLVWTRTQFGRNLFAVGGSPEAARFSGIRVESWQFWIFVITGLTGGSGGVIVASRLDYASAIMGQDIPLNAITAAVIGGVSLFGGVGSMASVLIGSIILAMLGNGMVLLHIPINYQLTLKGLVLILVVATDAYLAERRRRRVRTAFAG